jgi:hypothetical protein
VRALLGLAVAVLAVLALRAILGPVLATVVVAPSAWIAVAAAGWIFDRKVVFPPPPPLPEQRRRVIDVASRPVRSIDR